MDITESGCYALNGPLFELYSQVLSMSLTEQLITLVQQNPCLYDCRDKNYRNTPRKERLWKKISKELNESSDAIKTKWKNLKDGYTKHKKQKKPYINWIWGPYLTFLDSAMLRRRPVLNANDVLDQENEVKQPSRSSSTNGASINASPPPTDFIDESLAPPSPLTSRKRGCNDEQDCMDKVLDYLNNECRKDSIDLLFASYAKTLKAMKPRTQSTLKLKLAQIFAEAEIEDLQSENIASALSSEDTVMNTEDTYCLVFKEEIVND